MYNAACDRQKVVRILFAHGQEIGESPDEENIGQETERDGPQSRESAVVKEGQEQEEKRSSMNGIKRAAIYVAVRRVLGADECLQ